MPEQAVIVQWIQDNAAWILFAFSASFTLIHSLDELFSLGAPIWAYLEITKNPILGFFGLSVFAAIQWALAYVGYVQGNAVVLFILAYVRAADVLFSHWTPAALGKRPNPGFVTSFLYAGEAAFIAAYFA